MGDYLPPVIAELKGDIGDLAKKVAEAKALLNSLKTDINIPVTLDPGVVGLLEAIRTNVMDTSAELMYQTELLRNIGQVWKIDKDVTVTYVRAVKDAGDAAAVAAGGFRLLGTGIRLTGAAIHWIIAAGLEFLAVFIPAAIALGAAFAVAAQGAQNVYIHMSALYTATEATANMFHTTVGQALGLGSALQKAQNAANPVVYSILGGAVMALHGQFSNLANVGLEVTRVMQNFSARMVQDFQSGMGSQVTSILHAMIADLVTFGQILGNIGHAILNFAAAMPGLAEVLLRIVNGISQFILWLSKAPPILITVAMAMEEFWRWGGLVTTILSRLPFLLISLVTSFFGLVPVLTTAATLFQALIMVLPVFISLLASALTVAVANFSIRLATAANAVAQFTNSLVQGIAGMSKWGLAMSALVVGAMAFVIIEALRTKTAAEQMAASMQQTVDVARGMMVFSDIANNIAKLNTQLDQTAGVEHRATTASGQLAVGLGEAAKISLAAAGNAQVYHAALTQQEHDMINAAQAVTFLSDKYKVGFVGALELGTQAGVRWDQGIGKMNAAADINYIKVQQLIRGYQLMGQSAGAVGKDATVLGIESALAATRIQQLTQAWMQFMQQVTGGTNALATFEQGLQNMGTVATSTAGHLFAATGSMTQSTNQFAQSLTSFTGTSAQNWQNFDQVVTTGAENFINWMQTAGAMGVVSGQQMSGAIKGIVAQLIPFAIHSQAARVALASLAAQTGQTVAPTNKALEAWAKGGMTAKQLAQFVNEATAKMGNMAQVAQNLGAVIQNDLIDMFSKAKIAASGLPADLNALSNAIAQDGTTSSTTHGEVMKVIGDLLTLHVSVPVITGLLNTMGITISQDGVAALIASGKIHSLGASMLNTTGVANSLAAATRAVAAAIDSLHNKTIVISEIFAFHGNQGGPKAAGGPVAAGVSYLVGERGPEMFVPRQSGYIVPSGQTERMLGGGMSTGVTVHERQPIMVMLDGDVIYQTTKQGTLNYDIQNNARGRYGGASGKMARS